MSEPIISVSGLRGIVGKSLTPDVAIRYACAFADGQDVGKIVLSQDGRTTGSMLADALRAGLTAIGRDVIDVGVAATPTTGVLVRVHKAAGGIQISASHNPPDYNGLKLFAASGQVISAADGEQVISRFRNGTPEWVSHDSVGRVVTCEDTTSDHLQLIENTVSVPRIRQQQYRVVLDANHGSGSVLGKRLLEHLGCRVDVLGGEPDGRFEHPPEPTAENLSGVLSAVTRVGADIGFCQDPDADRLAVIDENGRYLGEEYTLAMCVDHVLNGRKGAVVTNCSTSRMSQDVALRNGVGFFQSAVGEANVCETMIGNEAVIGGEGNGGVIDPRVGYVRDSFVGMALLLDAMAARGQRISQLADELPRYAMVKTKVSLAREHVTAVVDALQNHFSDAETSDLDGLRLNWPGKWLLIRASNTEPIVRIMAEAPEAGEASRLCREAEEVIRE